MVCPRLWTLPPIGSSSNSSTAAAGTAAAAAAALRVVIMHDGKLMGKQVRFVVGCLSRVQALAKDGWVAG